jgi:DNA-binding transcriptional LysR family regulator
VSSTALSAVAVCAEAALLANRSEAADPAMVKAKATRRKTDEMRSGIGFKTDSSVWSAHDAAACFFLPREGNADDRAIYSVEYDEVQLPFPMFLRQLSYLVALSKERHFGRAADACNVSQPALSSAIRSIERELGMTIVQRGRRFEGFTEDGGRVLTWARRALADFDGMRQEARDTVDPAGVLRLGAIPTTLPIVPLLTGPCLEVFSRMRYEVYTLTASEILRKIHDFELDVGLSYLHDERLKDFDTVPLFRERYVLVARDGAMFEGRDSVSWADVARLPLCLLTRNMQSRRGIDAAFNAAGLEVVPRVETDSMMALYAYVRLNGLYSVLPHSVLSLLEMRQELTAIPLLPALNREIGLILLKRETRPTLLAAAMSVFERLDLQTRMDALIDL